MTDDVELREWLEENVPDILPHYHQIDIYRLIKQGGSHVDVSKRIAAYCGQAVEDGIKRYLERNS